MIYRLYMFLTLQGVKTTASFHNIHSKIIITTFHDLSKNIIIMSTCNESDFVKLSEIHKVTLHIVFYL